MTQHDLNNVEIIPDNDKQNEDPIFNILNSVFYQSQVMGNTKGCFMPMLCPTGNGKTYSTLSLIIKMLIDGMGQEKSKPSSKANSKPSIIYYVTNSVDNVSETHASLIRRIKDDSKLDGKQKSTLINQILYAPSNSNSLLDLLKNHPDKLSKILILFKLDQNQIINDIVDEIKNDLSLMELNVSAQQAKNLITNINNKASKCYSIVLKHIKKIQLSDTSIQLNDQNVDLISELIPGVKIETGKVKVVFLTTKKFLWGISQSKGKFFPTQNLKDSILLIDEIDRQHQEILSHLVSTNEIDLLSMIRTVHSNIKEHRLCAKPQYRGIQEMFDNYLEELKDFFEQWSLKHSFDIDESAIKAKNQILLFSDSLSTYNTNINKKISISFNDDNLQHEIAIRGRFNERIEKDFPKFIGRLGRLVIYKFQNLIHRVEERYRRNIVEMISPMEYQRLTSSQIIASILDQLNLHELRSQLSKTIFHLMHYSRNERTSAANYHTRGIRLIEVDRLPEAQDSVMFQYHGFNLSPSGMLASWVDSGCNILGISATAECRSVIHNFDIKYLRDCLGDRFIQLSGSQRDAIINYYHKERNYSENGINIVVKDVRKNLSFVRDLVGFYNGSAVNIDLFCCQNLFKCNLNELEFNYEWLGKACHAMKSFSFKDENRYMMVMLNRHIKSSLNDFFDWYAKHLSEQSKNDVKIVYGISANFLKHGEFQSQVIDHLEIQPGKVIAITTYQTMAIGKNPDYKVNESIEKGTLVKVGPRQNDRTDIDSLYLESPTNLISIQGKPDTKVSDRLLLLSYGMALQESGYITPMQAHLWSNEVISNESPYYACKNLKGRFYKKDSDDCLEAIYRVIEQTVGRTARTNLKRQNIYLFTDYELLDLLSNDNRNLELCSHEYRELVSSARGYYHHKQIGMQDKNLTRLHNRAMLSTRRSKGAIDRMLARISENPDDRSIRSWFSLRNTALVLPATMTPPQHSEYYVELPLEGNGYDCNNPKDENRLNEYRFFDNLCSPIDRIDELRAKLPLFMKNETVRRHFIKKGFATAWPHNSSHILTPPMFINIYLGALGEEVGKAILESHGFSFKPLPSEHFEKFDDIICHGEQQALIDFKHWELGAWRTLSDDERNNVMLKTSQKLSSLNLNKLVICNAVKENNEPICYFDSMFNPLPDSTGSSIIAIPNLVNQNDGSTDENAIIALLKWLSN